MTTAIAPLSGLDETTMQSLIAGGDCSRLSPAQQTAYYIARCEAAGLDPRAQPFAYMTLNGKKVLYATKACSDQLAGKHGVVCTILSQVTQSGIREVTVRATSKDGKSQEDMGAVAVENLKGEGLANALMKAVTKAKRRTILSLFGLGMLDETEVETVPGARMEAHQVHTVADVTPIVEAPTMAQLVEMASPPPPAAKPVIPSVLLLWEELLNSCGPKSDKSRMAKAKERLEHAATVHFGVTIPPKQDWTDDDADILGRILFPASDAPF